MKKIFSLLLSLAIIMVSSFTISTTLTSCSSKKEPIKLDCKYCNNTGVDQICHGSGDCSACEGTGKCDVCGATGKCTHCKGTGLVKAKCPKCHGYGFLKPKAEGEEPVPCKYCKASGLDPRGKKAPCPYCVQQTKEFKKRVESGKIDQKAYDFNLKNDGFVFVEKALKGIKKGTGKCPACLGTKLCNTCKGSGKCISCGGNEMCPHCKGHGFNIEVVMCPSCHDTIPYNSKECPKCHTKLKYDGADTSFAKQLPKTN